MSSSGRSLWPRLLLLGDSLTQGCFSVEGGWGSLLADSLQRQCDLVARGFSGYNSRQWMAVCRQLPKASLQGEVATLWLGANDACTSAQQGVPLGEYKDNLASIVHYIKTSCGVSDVILMTPPPADETAMKPEWVAERSGELTAKYALACKEVATELELTCVDLHTAFLQQSDWRSMLCDGLHLAPRGAALVHALLLPAVRQHLARHMPANMATDQDLILPIWTDLANKYPCNDVQDWVLRHKVEENGNN